MFLVHSKTTSCCYCSEEAQFVKWTAAQSAQFLAFECPCVGTEGFGSQRVLQVPGQQRQVYPLTPSKHVAPC